MRFIRKFVLFVCLVFGSVGQAEVYDVSTTAELREALASAAEAGGDNTIRLAAGTYSTQDDGEGAFTYLSKVDGSLTLSSETSQQMAILDGANVNTILEWYLEGNLLELIIENLGFRNAEHGALLGSYLESLTITNSSFEDNVSRANSASVRRKSIPQHATKRMSGSASTKSSNAISRDGCPVCPIGSRPPAHSINWGVQCPEQKIGSVHSRSVTRGRVAGTVPFATGVSVRTAAIRRSSASMACRLVG